MFCILWPSFYLFYSLVFRLYLSFASLRCQFSLLFVLDLCQNNRIIFFLNNYLRDFSILLHKLHINLLILIQQFITNFQIKKSIIKVKWSFQLTHKDFFSSLRAFLSRILKNLVISLAIYSFFLHFKLGILNQLLSQTS
jgi:hypothetical protein